MMIQKLKPLKWNELYVSPKGVLFANYQIFFFSKKEKKLKLSTLDCRKSPYEIFNARRRHVMFITCDQVYEIFSNMAIIITRNKEVYADCDT